MHFLSHELSDRQQNKQFYVRDSKLGNNTPEITNKMDDRYIR